MALRWADKTVEYSTTTTTGAYQLGGVPSGEAAGSQTFVAGIGDGNTCYYEAEEVGGSAYERGIGTVADASPDTLTRTTIHASSNGGSAVDWTSKTVRIMCVMPAYAVRRAMLTDSREIRNLKIVATKSGNAVTYAAKTLSGDDPSAENPGIISFARTDGGWDEVEVTSALSITVSSGSTLGFISGSVAQKTLIGFINNGGAAEMVVCGRPSGVSDNSIISTTAEGGAGGADSARAFYSATARTSKRLRIMGYATHALTNAGTWDSDPTDLLLTRAGATEIYAPEVLYDVTLGSNGAFDTNDVWPDGIPLGYERFEIELRLRANIASNDIAYLLFNNDTTLGNYRYQRQSAYGTGEFQDAGDNARVAIIPGSSGVADYLNLGHVIITRPQDSKTKNYMSLTGNRTSGTDQGVEQILGHWESTAAITRIQIRTGNHPTDLFVAGSSMRLIGYRTMTVLQ
jgi:hypothetical protein